MNIGSLLLVGVGIVLTATFFVESPLPGAPSASAAAVDRTQPTSPVVGAERRPVPRAQRAVAPAVARPAQGPVARGPKDKTLRMTVPGMARIRNDEVPVAAGDDEDAFHDHGGVHLRGTGSPWQRVANVYIAGHRLGYPNTQSWLTFWDLNKLQRGDKILLTDSIDRRYVYRVYRTFVVDPTEVSVTRPVPGKNVVTLQTCTLPDYSRRLIVRAEKVSTETPPSAANEGRRTG